VEKVGLGLHLCLGFDSIILFLVRIDDFNSSLSIKKLRTMILPSFLSDS
jgi:hypothetical protein